MPRAPKPPRAPRRPVYSPEAPLVLDATLPRPVALPARARHLARPLHALVRALPSAPATRAGRRAAALTRLALGAAAVLLVTGARDAPLLGAAGVLVALLTLVVPLSAVRRVRWLQRTAGLSAPRTRTVQVPARVHWDGRKLTVSTRLPDAEPASAATPAPGRPADGDRVWRSLRPAAAPLDMRSGQHNAQSVLGLVPTNSPARSQLWFVASHSDASPADAPPLPLPPDVEPVTLSPADLATLRAALAPGT